MKKSKTLILGITLALGLGGMAHKFVGVYKLVKH
jgi:hypothetical protein